MPRKLKPRDILPVKGSTSDQQEEAVYGLRTFGLEPALAVREGEAPLGSSSVPISRTRSRKGLKGITTHGKRMVRNGCHILEEVFGRGRCGFGTFTLPDLNLPDYAAVCTQWSDIVNRFTQEVKRTLATRTEKTYIVFVTEFQEKRFEKEKRAYPHLHICYPARPQRDYNWYISASEFRAMWKQAVERCCLSSYCFDASVDCVVVKKSVGAYLSKYLTKGAGDIARYLETGLPFGCLGHWWGLTGELRSAIKEGTRSSPAIAGHLWREIRAIAEGGHVKWLKYITIETHLTGERIVGMCGCLDDPYRKWLDLEYPR